MILNRREWQRRITLISLSMFFDTMVLSVLLLVRCIECAMWYCSGWLCFLFNSCAFCVCVSMYECGLICAFVCVVFLVQQWHPDRWTRTPSLLGEAKRKFQQIQEAYSGNFLFFHRFISMQSISNWAKLCFIPKRLAISFSFL